jgi:hypothetical protein
MSLNAVYTEVGDETTEKKTWGMAHVSECFYQKSACDETADKHRSWL